MSKWLKRQKGKWTWVDENEYHQDPSRQMHKQTMTESRPWVSRGMAIHRSQVEKFNSDARDAGLTGVRYDRNGCLEATSRGQRRAEMKRRGMIDRDAGYGDAF
jgi:hypothetical protein